MQVERFRAGGLAWRAAPSARACIERLAPRLADLAALPGARLVKRNRARSVWRIPLEGRVVYVKRHRVRGVADRMKSLVGWTRAENEWRAARGLLGRGFHAAPPLALGIARSGPWMREGVFVAEEVLGVPFDNALSARSVAGREIEPIVAEAIGVFRRLEAAGVLHPDLHGGNLLVHEAEDGPRVALVDLHSVRFRGVSLRVLGRGAMRAKFAHSLSALLPRESALKALARLAPRDEPALRRRVEEIERRRVRSRSLRCVKRSSRFAVERREGWWITRRRDVPRDALLERVRDGTGGPASLEIAGVPRAVLLWRRPRPSWLAIWKRLHALEVRGIDSFEAWACLERRRFGRVVEAVLVTEAMTDVRCLSGVENTVREKVMAVASRLHAAGLTAAPESLRLRPDGDGLEVLVVPTAQPLPDRPMDAESAAREQELLSRAMAAAEPIS